VTEENTNPSRREPSPEQKPGPDERQAERRQENDSAGHLQNNLQDNLQENSQEYQPVAGKEIDDFFQRLPGNFRWPKPNAEAVAAAVEAIQRMSGSVPASLEEADDDLAGSCSACGGSLPANARFCVWCGVSQETVGGVAAIPAQPAAGQHHYHHHYHHLVPGSGSSPGTAGVSERAASSTPRGRAPGAAGTSTGGRAEAGARQVVQDWAQACNTRHIDDLLELYAPDATIIRSSVPPVRSLPAIREFLVSLLEAGLGDVEMESLRLELMGDIALDLGRCKMLVPVAMGKRREERGKYLVVLVKQPAGNWKILADCWSSDLAVTTPPQEPTHRAGNDPMPPLRKGR
jgi:ketosteroid isomerase-like protein